MAALRAPTMATTIHSACPARMPTPWAASAAEVRAKGSANTVCEKRIMRP